MREVKGSALGWLVRFACFAMWVCALALGQPLHVTIRSLEQDHRWIMINLSAPLKNPQFNTGRVY